MAVVPIAIATTVVPHVFASPGVATGSRSAAPIARLGFRSLTTLPAKDAADEQVVTITSTMPPKFIYRIAHISAFAVSTSIAVFADYQATMPVVVNENGGVVHNFGLLNDLIDLSGPSGLGFKLADDTVTNDFGALYNVKARDTSQLLINAIRGTNTIVVTWIDSTADATAAVSLSFSLTLDQFTPAQWNAAPLNTSVLTYPS